MAKLKIYSDIVDEEERIFLNSWGVDGVSFQSVDDFITSIPTDDNAIDIHIHCRGGNVMEGWAIYDALRQSGKEISTTIDGECSSMATIILLAAPLERRKAYKNAHFCIHNPAACDFALNWCDRLTADNLTKQAESLTKQAEMLQAEQTRILNLYVERTGADREVLQAIMNEDVIYGMDKAVELGFISEIIPPITAHNQKQINDKMKQVSVKESVLNRMLAKLGIKSVSDFKIVDMVVTAADGTEITIDKESGEPQVGDKASPDGSFVMDDGTTIVVADGVITEILPPAEDAEGEETPAEETENVDELKARIAELEAENEELKAKIAELEGTEAKTEEETEILAKVAKAGGAQWLDKVLSMKSTFNAKNTRTQIRETENEVEESPVQRAMRQLNEKIENRKK